MRYNSSALFPILMLLLLAGLTFWLQKASQPDQVVSKNLRHDPDYIAEHFKIKRFNAAGVLFQTLDADRMLHYPDDDSSAFEMPHLVYVQAQPTYISSDKATADSGGKTIQLEHNVVIIHETQKNPPTRITTSALTAYPDDETAHTKMPVVITQGQTVVHGIGMDVNNKTQISVLHGRVHGTIVSRQP